MNPSEGPSGAHKNAKEVAKNIHQKLFIQQLRHTKLKNIRYILRSDAKRIFSSVICLVMLFGLCVVPCLYAWFNIFSNWDPYGVSATSRIKVAVVSVDEGLDLFGLHLNVGEQVISGLESNDQIGWQFKDSLDDALEAVYSGDCYAALVVPETFTADIASFLTLDFDHPQLLYYENDKKNAIAPKITGKAKTAVQEQVNATVMETVGKYVGDIIGLFTENGVTPEELIGHVSDNIEDVQDKLNTLDSALGSLVLTLQSAQSMTYYSGQLFTHTAGNLASVRDSNDKVITDIKDKTTDTVSDTIDTIKKLEEIINIILGQLNTENASEDVTTSDNTAAAADSGSAAAETAVSDSGTSESASDSITQETVSPDSTTADETIPAETGVDAGTQEAVAAEVSADAVDTETTVQDNSSAAVSANEEDSTSAAASPIDALNALSDSIDALTDTVTEFSDSVTAISDQTEQISSDSPVAAAQAITDSSSSAEAVQTTADETTDTAAGTPADTDGDTVSEAPADTSAADDIQQTIDDIAKEAEEKAIQYFENLKPVLDLLLDILNDPTKYNDQLFNVFINPMDSIASRLYDMSNRLGDTATSLASLQASLQIINDDLERVQEVLASLAGSEYLNDLMDSLSGNYENLGSFFASPISMETVVLYPIDNYGSAMAPFYTVLAQWVGALFCICLLKVRIRKEDVPMELTMQEKFFGRFGVFFICALIQAIIVAAGDLWYVGIYCAHPALFFLSCITTGICFITINYSLLFSLESIGLGASVIIMVIQVAGSGGSYPVQVVPEIFQKLYPYMPFNYAMNSMREAIGGTYDSYFIKYQLVLLLITVIFLLLGQLLYNPAHRLNQLISRSREKSEVMIP